MHIGVCKVTLRLPDNQNLKGKRRVINSLLAKLRQKFNIAAAEVENNDLWQIATLGICCISNNHHHIDETLSHIMTFILEQTGEFELLNQKQEILSGF